MADDLKEDENEWEDVPETFYDDAKTYWTGIPPTVDGMLGGFEKISPTDINGSKAFLRPFLKILKMKVVLKVYAKNSNKNSIGADTFRLKVGGGYTENKRALDCGAGIGRITKRLLLPMFDAVDMVELNQNFLDAAPKFIGEDSCKIERFICSGLQDFEPEESRYNIIWCQWVLGHLTDDHLVEFFKRCQKGLTKDGILVIKENVTCASEREFDELDSSYTRSKDTYVDLIRKSGLTILREQKQRGFPKGLYSVFMFALK